MKKQMWRLIWPLILLNSSCAQLPPLPQGNLFVLDVKTQKAYGKDIPSSVQNTPSPTVVVPFSNIDKWVCFDPESFKNVQIYIQQMTEVAKRQCQP